MEIRDYDLDNVMKAVNQLTSKTNRVYVLCVSMPGEFHMPKTGLIEIEVEIEGGSLLSGKVRTEHRTHEIRGFCTGLNSTCLVAQLEHCSLYLDIPVKEQVDYGHAFAVVMNPNKFGDRKIEEICHWLDRTAK